MRGQRTDGLMDGHMDVKKDGLAPKSYSCNMYKEWKCLYGKNRMLTFLLINVSYIDYQLGRRRDDPYGEHLRPAPETSKLWLTPSCTQHRHYRRVFVCAFYFKVILFQGQGALFRGGNYFSLNRSGKTKTFAMLFSKMIGVMQKCALFIIIVLFAVYYI